MKRLLLLMLLVTAATSAQEIVSIPDVNFKDYLLSQIEININSDTEIQVSEAQAATVLNISNLNIASLQGIEAFTNLVNLNCSENPLLTIVDLSANVELEIVELSFTGITTIDFSQNTNLNSVRLIDCPNLDYVNLKNGKDEDNIEIFFISPSMVYYVCLDDSQINSPVLQGIGSLDNLEFTSSYCSFTPGGDFNTITGTLRFDNEDNGCDTSDAPQSFVKLYLLDVFDEHRIGLTYTDQDGVYNFYTGSGAFIVQPVSDNHPFYNTLPETAVVDFTGMNNTVTVQDFCTMEAVAYSDIEIVIMPVVPARPGFNAVYKIVYRNKSNQTVSGTVNFNYNDAVLDFVSALPTANTQAAGLLTFNYSNLRPFENRSILITLNVNAPTEIPAVNIGDLLTFSAAIDPSTIDGMPEDNIFDFHQTVVGSYDPNNKQCIQGSIVPPSQIGKYLHYVINFENTGTHVAENVVVRDTINTNQFDISSLEILNASADMSVKVNENIIEFIFKNIHLPIGGHGNVLFKIRTLENLTPNSEVSNTANIFFDYNFPIITDPANTRFSNLDTKNFNPESDIKVFPNPTQDVVNIRAKGVLKVVELYDVDGRLIEKQFPNRDEIQLPMLSKLTGIYFLKVITNQGTFFQKLIKK